MGDCPHQFGYYKIGDASDCGKFLNCVNGRAYNMTCPSGLAFNPLTYQVKIVPFKYFQFNDSERC